MREVGCRAPSSPSAVSQSEQVALSPLSGKEPGTSLAEENWRGLSADASSTRAQRTQAQHRTLLSDTKDLGRELIVLSGLAEPTGAPFSTSRFSGEPSCSLECSPNLQDNACYYQGHPNSHKVGAQWEQNLQTPVVAPVRLRGD